MEGRPHLAHRQLLYWINSKIARLESKCEEKGFEGKIDASMSLIERLSLHSDVCCTIIIEWRLLDKFGVSLKLPRYGRKWDTSLSSNLGANLAAIHLGQAYESRGKVLFDLLLWRHFSWVQQADMALWVHRKRVLMDFFRDHGAPPVPALCATVSMNQLPYSPIIRAIDESFKPYPESPPAINLDGAVLQWIPSVDDPYDGT